MPPGRASTAAVSAPNAGARRTTSRARGGLAARPATSSKGPETAAAIGAMAASMSHRPPAASASSTAAAATRPDSGSATASARKHGPWASDARRPPAAAATSPNPTRSRCPGSRPWLVIETHTRGPSGRARRSPLSMPICSSARGRALSITTSAAAMRRARSRRPAAEARSSATERFAPLSRSKNRGGPTTGAVGASRRLDLDHACPGLGQQLATEGPGPQRGEVDDRRLPEWTCSPVVRPHVPRPHGQVECALRRGPHGAHGGEGEAQQRGLRIERGRGEDRRRPAQTVGHGSAAGDVPAQPGGKGRDILGPCEGHRQPPVAGGHQPGPAAAADGAAPRKSRQGRPLAEQSQAVEAGRPPRRRARGPRPPGRPGRSTRAARRGAGPPVVRSGPWRRCPPTRARSGPRHPGPRRSGPRRSGPRLDPATGYTGRAPRSPVASAHPHSPHLRRRAGGARALALRGRVTDRSGRSPGAHVARREPARRHRFWRPSPPSRAWWLRSAGRPATPLRWPTWCPRRARHRSTTSWPWRNATPSPPSPSPCACARRRRRWVGPSWLSPPPIPCCKPGRSSKSGGPAAPVARADPSRDRRSR